MGLKPSPGFPPIVPLIPEIDFIKVILYNLKIYTRFLGIQFNASKLEVKKSIKKGYIEE